MVEVANLCPTAGIEDLDQMIRPVHRTDHDEVSLLTTSQVEDRGPIQWPVFRAKLDTPQAQTAITARFDELVKRMSLGRGRPHHRVNALGLEVQTTKPPQQRQRLNATRIADPLGIGSNRISGGEFNRKNEDEERRAHDAACPSQ